MFGAGVLNKRRPRRARANCSRSSRKFSNVLHPLVRQAGALPGPAVTPQAQDKTIGEGGLVRRGGEEVVVLPARGAHAWPLVAPMAEQ